jgi:DNA uptake protein ComE-like DNA-binding protein
MEDSPRPPLWEWSPMARLVMIVAVASLVLAIDAAHFLLVRDRPPPDLQLVIDPNTAPAGVLTALPRLGPSLVGRIVDQRELQPFRSLDEVDQRVRGIGPATAASLRPFFRFEPPGIDGTESTITSAD